MQEEIKKNKIKISVGHWVEYIFGFFAVVLGIFVWINSTFWDGMTIILILGVIPVTFIKIVLKLFIKDKIKASYIKLVIVLIGSLVIVSSYVKQQNSKDPIKNIEKTAVERKGDNPNTVKKNHHITKTNSENIQKRQQNNLFLEATSLKLYDKYSSLDSGSIDYRITNPTNKTISSWIIEAEVYDSKKEYLGRASNSQGTNLKPKNSVIQEITFNNVKASQITFWDVRLTLVVDEDSPYNVVEKYTLKPTNQQKVPLKDSITAKPHEKTINSERQDLSIVSTENFKSRMLVNGNIKFSFIGEQNDNTENVKIERYANNTHEVMVVSKLGNIGRIIYTNNIQNVKTENDKLMHLYVFVHSLDSQTDEKIVGSVSKELTELLNQVIKKFSETNKSIVKSIDYGNYKFAMLVAENGIYGLSILNKKLLIKDVDFSKIVPDINKAQNIGMKI